MASPIMPATAMYEDHPAEGRLEQGSPASEQHKSFVLALVCLAGLMTALDAVVVTVANPTIERSLKISPVQLQWNTTAYVLTFGGFLLLGGRLADALDRRRILIVGVALFTLASIGAGASQTAIELTVFRGIQGLGAAMSAPSALSILTTTFAEGKERRHALGAWAASLAIGSVTAFAVGGVLTSTVGWRWIFFVNVPIGALTIGGALWRIPSYGRSQGRLALDLPGAFAFTTAGVLLIYGLSKSQSAGWQSRGTLMPLGGSLLLVIAFALIESRAKAPILPGRLLLRRESYGLIATVCLYAMIFGQTFLLALYLQQVLGYSALHAGLLSIPLTIAVGVTANLSSRLFMKRIEPPRLAAIGLLIVSCSSLWLSFHPGGYRYLSAVLPALIIWGIGSGAANISLLLTVSSGVAHEAQGVVTGLFTTIAQIGGAIGVATLATITVSAGHGAAIGDRAAEAHGLHVAFLVAAMIGAGGALFTAVCFRTQRKQIPLVAETYAE